MSRTRIAVFEGFGRRPSRRYGAPLFNNPRVSGYGFDPREMPSGYGRPSSSLGSLGRRGYYVEPYYAKRGTYGPATESGRLGRKLKRRGYHVKKGPNSPAQIKFKKAAKSCARRRNKRQSFQQCMAKKLGHKRRSKKR